MAYTMTVVEVNGGREHDLPADTVTRDLPLDWGLRQETAAPALDWGVDGRGPLVPLAFRPHRDVFHVASRRWPGLAGKALRVSRSAGGSVPEERH